MNEPVNPNQPVKPLPKAAQAVILVVALAIAGGIVWWMRPETRQCTVKETYGSGAICIVDGAIKQVPAIDKANNAKQLGGVPLDEVLIEDASGSRNIYFDPKKVDLGSKTSARVRGEEIREEAIGGSRFVVRDLEP